MPYPPASLCRWCRGSFSRKSIDNHERFCKMSSKHRQFGLRTREEIEASVIADKAARMEDALRIEYSLLRRAGNRNAEWIDRYLQDAPDESKARLYDIIMGVAPQH